MNERGQAAVTDALFFLLIVVALCTFLFFYTNNYGAEVDRYVQTKYLSGYASASLQTILYSSAPRDFDKKLSDEGIKEVDYLITLVKEDFAWRRTNSALSSEPLSPEMKNVLKDNVFDVLKPIVASHDYLFYIVSREQDNLGTEKFPVFVFLHLSEFKKISSDDGSTHWVYDTDNNYFCSPQSFGVMDAFVLSTGASSQAKIPLAFKKIELVNSKYVLEKENLMAGLIFWTPTNVKLKSDGTTISEKFVAMNCVGAD